MRIKQLLVLTFVSPNGGWVEVVHIARKYNVYDMRQGYTREGGGETRTEQERHFSC